MHFRLVPARHLERAVAIEQQGFPEDEAASLQAFQFRQESAPDLFLGAYNDDDELIAYVCSTLSDASSLTHESMSTHVPGASSVCIHSICVAPEYQRQGIALRLLQEYVTRCESSGAYERILLITHEPLRPLYEKAGFEWLGPSHVVHGSKPWFEMRRTLARPQPPPGVFEALQRPSNPDPSSTRLDSFPGGIADVSLPDSTNKFDIICPRPGCGSIILKSGVAKLTEAPVAPSVQMELHPLLTALPESNSCWLVTPSPMEFENIGFSRPVQSPGEEKIKFLACAECDLGPLGHCKEGGTEFWLSCSRVGYRVSQSD
ncbi:acyl-CoA N-acyltransferase [Roridomyces roridus]|uniref:Acyl-CoA N-acyltransferase n=1 Tax=Roridomyces roridus TaxID=1738132 RepID=A0AAD7BHI5_9AGAR|nr:acyl-CoA N-acyltransferase [Roridomyces roridus]